MLMLLAGIDSDTRKLMGRWRSDAMFRYLHGQAQQLVAPLASQMLAAGNFRLLPSGLPKQAEDLLAVYPNADLEDDADLEYLAAARHWEATSPDDNE
jgi:hypothetical protein